MTNSDYSKPLSTGQFLLMFILMAIPLVNIILLFVWAFSGNTNINRRNYCRAALLLLLIGVCISILSAVAGVAVINTLPEYLDQIRSM